MLSKHGLVIDLYEYASNHPLDGHYQGAISLYQVRMQRSSSFEEKEKKRRKTTMRRAETINFGNQSQVHSLTGRSILVAFSLY